jgi:Leucine-rich repeat (LRR) protein
MPCLTSLDIDASQAQQLAAGSGMPTAAALALGACSSLFARLRALRVSSIQEGSELSHLGRLLGSTTQLTKLVLEVEPVRGGSSSGRDSLWCDQLLEGCKAEPTQEGDQEEGAAATGAAPTAAAVASSSSGGPASAQLPLLHHLEVQGPVTGALEVFLAREGAAAHLTALHLSGGATWEPALGPLAACSNLQQLVLVGSAGWGAPSLVSGGLAPLSALSRLELRGCGLMEVPGGAFGISGLRQLSLEGNGSFHVIPQAISRLQQLQQLDINGTCVGDWPPQLGTWLPELEVIRVVYTDYMVCVPPGLTRLTLLEADERILLNDCDFSNLVTLKHLSVCCVPWYEVREDLTLLTSLETLSLDMDGGPAYGYSPRREDQMQLAQVVLPSPMPNLRDVSITMRAMAQVGQPSRCVMVSGLHAVVGAQHLTRLCLDCMTHHQWAALGQLGVLPQLQSLLLGDSGGEVYGLLGHALPWLLQQPRLAVLTLKGCHIEGADLEQLPGQLEGLFLQRSTMSPAQPSALPQLCGLRRLELSNTNQQQLPPWLLSLQGLEELSLCGFGLAAGGWEVLGQLPLLRRVGVDQEQKATAFQHAPHLCWAE